MRVTASLMLRDWCRPVMARQTDWRVFTYVMGYRKRASSAAVAGA